MLHLAGVLGEWKMNKGSWKFMDTPPVFVNNDRQLDSMCEMSKSMPLRLCVSVKNGNVGNHDQGFNREDTAIYGKGHGKKKKNVDRQDSNQEPEVEVSNFHDAKVIEKGQWFKNKSELSWSIRMLSIERKFRIVVSKSDKKLLVVKCADTSCNWMVRAAKTNPTCEFFWVTKYIDKHTCFSRNIAGPRASSKVITSSGKLWKLRSKYETRVDFKYYEKEIWS
ncbi:LOW QUALITY PROTEIN: hypothetical protein HID58_024104 [Brassica napus]|uniref:Transposase MuDR plant domain-containing protein n=1 Tax=Brassica napus TaxID=3708 RepID=A0ABQ8D466_BRANA|nr:LOW QUALITY PROTEIN: hypothetical protein HID58_024104 [Brassica napus]